MNLKKTASIGLLVAMALTTLPATVRPAWAGGDDPSAKDAQCELRIEGESITSLKLGGASGSFHRPGKVLRLPAGWYYVSEVTLEGGYRHQGDMASFLQENTAQGLLKSIDDTFELTPDRPHTLKIGGPLSPTVKVNRQGKYLKLDYDLVDADGRSYRNSGSVDRSNPPRFVVYQGDREIASDKFAYG